MRPIRPLLLVCAMPLASAQTLPAPIDADAVRGFASQHAAAAEGITRFEVRIGNLDPRLVLAPCRRIEPFLPAGARMWGRSSVGVRCAEGANWSVMVPVTVAAWGTAVVAAAPLAAGTVLSEQDLREQEVELTREPPTVARAIDTVAGRVLSRPLAPGQALRVDMVRTRPVVQAGDPVRLRIVGAGFAISAAGHALASAGDGQPVRVRTELGKVLTGVAREGRQVDVAL
jgi:flagella basal body P-ring formation protein FlgA